VTAGAMIPGATSTKINARIRQNCFVKQMRSDIYRKWIYIIRNPRAIRQLEVSRTVSSTA